jgi:uncharacterized Rmd1/YagE family protein
VINTLKISGDAVTVRALLVGERIDLKGMESTQRLGTSPLLISAGEGQYAILFRYGVAVLFGMNPLEERNFLDNLHPLMGQPYDKKETEETLLRIDPAAEEQAANNVIQVQVLTVERLQAIADILAKSVILAHYESGLAAVFDTVEPLAMGLRQKGKAWPKGKDLIRYIGDTLLIQHKMVGRVEVTDKPELLWDRPELGRFYGRLEDEYELIERHAALERKLALLSRTVETLLDLLQDRRNLRVEWYIVILIVVEIILTLYQLFLK